MYWIFFWDNDPKVTYVQQTLPGERGTYEIDANLQQTRDVLRKQQFFLLNPGEHTITDRRETAVTVRRCGVITRLVMYPLTGLDDAVYSLFADFDLLVKNAKKTKTSDTPEDFKHGLLFEGE